MALCCGGNFAYGYGIRIIDIYLTTTTTALITPQSIIVDVSTALTKSKMSQ